MKQARADRYRREHAEQMARLRAIAGKPLPPRRTRIALAGAYLAVVAVMITLALVAEAVDWAGIALPVAVLPLVALWFALHRATRLLPSGPDEVLDELQVRLRDSYHRQAYVVLGVVGAVVAGVLVIGSSTEAGISAEVGTALGWGLFGMLYGLPLLVAAVRLPDLADER